MDETCWNCGALLRFYEPKGTLQQEIEGGYKRQRTLQQEMESRYQPNEWIERNKGALIAIGVALILVVVGVGALFVYQEVTKSSTSGSLRIDGYSYGEIPEGVWFAAYVKNDGFWWASGTLIAEVETTWGTFTNSTEVGSDAMNTVSSYILVEIPVMESVEILNVHCYLSAL